MKESLSRKAVGLIIILLLVSLCQSSFAFSSDKELEDSAERLDKKYFPIFLQSIDIINNKQFQNLRIFYEADLLSDSRIDTKNILFENWVNHEEIVFIDPKSLLKKGHKINFPIDWKADPLKNSTWVLYFQNLSWLNDYLSKGEKGDEESALIAFKITKDWLISNVQWPPRNGKFVYDDHGISERLRIFHKAFRLYRKMKYRDDEFYNLLLTGIVNHIALMSTKEKYNWNNHGIMLDNSLLGVINDLKEFKMHDEVLELATQRVLRQFRLAFTSEGIHKEHSPCYHVWVTLFMLNSLDLIEKSGQSIPGDIKNIVDKTAAFTTHVLKTDKTFPLFGDCSEAQSGFAPGAIAAKYYDDHPELKYVMTNGHEGLMPQDKIKIFPESGWAVFRDKWPPDIYAAIQSDFNSKVHYHEDDTSFVISAYGNDLIIDSGLYTYEHDSLSNHMTKSKAHNVLLIDDKDFNSDMRNTGLSGITRSFQDNEREGRAIVELTHPHYDHIGLRTYRQFGQIGDASFMVKDIIGAESSHKYTQLFHLSPGAKVEHLKEGTFKITWPIHHNVLWLKSGFDSYDLVEGAMKPVQGWYFPKFGVAVPHPVLRLYKIGKSSDFSTLLIVTETDKEPEWQSMIKESERMSEAIGRIERRKLERQSVPARWSPSMSRE